VLSADGAGSFPVAGAVRCGAVGAEVAAGSVVYITTGAPVPSGADAVVQIEDTLPSEDGKTVEILKAAKPGQDIRTVGSDVQKVSCCNQLGRMQCMYLRVNARIVQEKFQMQDQVCLEEGEVLGPAECGILATVGAHRVSVHRYAKYCINRCSTCEQPARNA
jgi:gephyrin